MILTLKVKGRAKLTIKTDKEITNTQFKKVAPLGRGDTRLCWEKQRKAERNFQITGIFLFPNSRAGYRGIPFPLTL